MFSDFVWIIVRWAARGPVVSTVASQHKGPGLETRLEQGLLGFSPIGVNVTANGWLSLCVGLVREWWLVQVVPCCLPNKIRDKIRQSFLILTMRKCAFYSNKGDGKSRALSVSVSCSCIHLWKKNCLFMYSRLFQWENTVTYYWQFLSDEHLC